MAIVNVKMPNLGESVHEATIVTWQVKSGDKVEKYDVLLEAQSDKVSTEIPSDYTGIVKDILVKEDQTVAIGTEILTIEVENEEVAGSGDEDKKYSEDNEVRSTEAVAQAEQVATPDNPTPAVLEQESVMDPSKEVARHENTSQTKPNLATKIRYSPAVVRIAQEKGIDLKQVQGTGKHGRVTRKDILNFDPSLVSKSTKQVKDKSNDSADTSSSLTLTRENKDQTSTVKAELSDEVLKADGVRKAIAKKMTQSMNEIPHAWLQVEADVSNIVSLRKATKDNFREREGVTLSYFPFFVKAVAQALIKHPKLNASWDDGNIILHKDINLSIAVATEDNLFVPVIKHVDDLSISGIAKEVKRLAEAARSGQLKSEDMVGGTMTVNNTGSFGSVSSMGIINYPQAAILQVESIVKRVVPTTDGGFKFAHMINLCLSIDHRILDGLAAGRFLADVKDNLSKFTYESDLY